MAVLSPLPGNAAATVLARISSKRETGNRGPVSARLFNSSCEAFAQAVGRAPPISGAKSTRRCKLSSANSNEVLRVRGKIVVKNDNR